VSTFVFLQQVIGKTEAGPQETYQLVVAYQQVGAIRWCGW